MSAEHDSIDVIEPEGTEVARYRVSSGERVLIGRRVAGTVEISDHSVEGAGRVYPVDSGFREYAHLSGFVSDYLEQAERLDACPMSGQGILTMLRSSEEEQVADLLGETA